MSDLHDPEHHDDDVSPTRVPAHPLLALAALTVAVGCQDRELPTQLAADHVVAFSKGQSKTAVCHYDATTSNYHLITIADPAMDAHIAHGDAMPGDALPDHSARFDSNCGFSAAVLVAAASYSTALYGGLGGNAETNHCLSGSVAVGMQGYTGAYAFGGNWVGQVRLACAALRGDGTLGASSETGDLGWLIAFPSPIPFNGACAPGQMLVGGNGSAAHYVAQVGGDCGTISRILSAAGGSDSSIGPWGAAAGTGYTAACAAGSVVTGVTGREGYLVDTIGFICTPIAQQTL
jgi:hypothetical protein